MHPSAFHFGGTFFRCYLGSQPAQILDVGSYDVNGSLRAHAKNFHTYTGVDVAAGPGVDVVLDDPYILPFADNVFDAIVATSVFEHASCFWLLFLEMIRVSRDGGFIYLNAPSDGPVHRHPIDCWRFYPDAGLALTMWATHCGKALSLVESGVAYKEDRLYNDFVAVFQKSASVLYGGDLIVEDPHYVFTNIRRHSDKKNGVHHVKHAKAGRLLSHFKRRIYRTIGIS